MDLSNAKILILPGISGYYNEDIIDFIKDNEYVFLKIKNPKIRYLGYKLNEHHFTTKYHRDVIIPTLSNLLDFEFDSNDYIIISNIIETDDNAFDLSYYAPKDPNYRFEVKGLDCGVEYTSGFDGLLGKNEYAELLKRTGEITDYHKLYAFPHSCSIVKNLYKHNNRTLFISGDSQAVPFIPVLCTIFKEVWYFDNRSDMSFKDLIDNKEFTDILIEIHQGSIQYYIQKNLK